MTKKLREEMDAEQRPQRNKMLSSLEALKSQHEDVYDKMGHLLQKLAQLNFRAQFH